jgi:hypothetical protein
MNSALARSQKEFKQAKKSAEMILVKEQKAMADPSPEGFARAQKYATEEQKVVERMEQESIDQQQFSGAKKRDSAVEKWLKMHRDRGAIPNDQPPMLFSVPKAETPQAARSERREAPQAAPILAPRYPVSSMAQSSRDFFDTP